MSPELIDVVAVSGPFNGMVIERGVNRMTAGAWELDHPGNTRGTYHYEKDAGARHAYYRGFTKLAVYAGQVAA
jgi:hypothetical protein